MIYLDVGGRGPGLVHPDEALIPCSDRGFLYGDGLFETVLLRGGRMPLLPYHLERLAESAAALAIPCDLGAVATGVLAVADAFGDEGEYALRITLSRGAAPGRGYQPPGAAAPTLLVMAAAYRRPAGPLGAITASLRISPSSPLCRHKSLSALEKVVARAEAAQQGADEALLLNLAGHITEGAATNLFAQIRGRWITPPVADGCLPGVMRRRVIELTGAEERSLRPEDLFTADGVWLCNALMGLLPLFMLDSRRLRDGHGPAPRPDDLFAEVQG